MNKRLSLLLLFTAISAYYYLSIAPVFLSHHDLGWHLAAGDLIRATGSIPKHDPWSFTAGAERWYNLSWLWDVLASILFQYGHFDALVWVTLAIGCLITALLGFLCLRQSASPLAAGFAVLFASLVYPLYVPPPDAFLVAAPQVVTLVLSVAFYALCLTRRWVWSLPLLMLLWVNLHGGFPAGCVVIAAFMAQAWVQKDKIMFRTFVAVGVLCLCATLINPLGVDVYGGLLRTLGHFHQHYVTEWQSFPAGMSWPISVPAVLYVALFVGLELFLSRGVPIAIRIVSWFWLLLGMMQLRYMSLFFVLSAPHMALQLGRLRLMQDITLPRANVLLCVALLVASPVPFLYRHDFPQGAQLPAQIYPEVEIAYIQKHFPQGRLLNHWNYGGFLIFKARGKPQVFIDGRASTAYPDAVLRDYFKLPTWEIDESAWNEVLEKYHINTVLWPKMHVQAQRFFAARPGWKLVYSGPLANVYAKSKPSQ